MTKFILAFILFLNCSSINVNMSWILLYDAPYGENVLVVYREKNGHEKYLCCEKVYRSTKDANFKCVSKSSTKMIESSNLIKYVNISKENCN